MLSCNTGNYLIKRQREEHVMKIIKARHTTKNFNLFKNFKKLQPKR